MICSVCGKKTFFDFLQCPKCGSPLPEPTAVAWSSSEPIAAASSGDAKEVAASAPSKQEEFTFPQKNGFWPILNSQSAARWAAKQGAYAAFVIAAFTSIAVFWIEVINPQLKTKYEITPRTITYLVAMAAIGFLIWRKNSRLAAVSGLLLYTTMLAIRWRSINFSTGFLAILLTLGFIHGVRGCFAWHKFSLLSESESRAEKQ